jgi:hypothetical protein
VIKLPPALDFVRPANPCRIFALLQINDGVGAFDFGITIIVLLSVRGHVGAISWVCGDPYWQLGASRVHEEPTRSTPISSLISSTVRKCAR